MDCSTQTSDVEGCVCTTGAASFSSHMNKVSAATQTDSTESCTNPTRRSCLPSSDFLETSTLPEVVDINTLDTCPDSLPGISETKQALKGTAKASVGPEESLNAEGINNVKTKDILHTQMKHWDTKKQDSAVYQLSSSTNDLISATFSDRYSDVRLEKLVSPAGGQMLVDIASRPSQSEVQRKVQEDEHSSHTPQTLPSGLGNEMTSNFEQRDGLLNSNKNEPRANSLEQQMNQEYQEYLARGRRRFTSELPELQEVKPQQLDSTKSQESNLQPSLLPYPDHYVNAVSGANYQQSLYCLPYQYQPFYQHQPLYQYNAPTLQRYGVVHNNVASYPAYLPSQVTLQSEFANFVAQNSCTQSNIQQNNLTKVAPNHSSNTNSSYISQQVQEAAISLSEATNQTDAMDKCFGTQKKYVEMENIKPKLAFPQSHSHQQDFPELVSTQTNTTNINSKAEHAANAELPPRCESINTKLWATVVMQPAGQEQPSPSATKSSNSATTSKQPNSKYLS